MNRKIKLEQKEDRRYIINSSEYKTQLEKFLKNLQGELEMKGINAAKLASAFGIFKSMPSNKWNFETDIDFDLENRRKPAIRSEDILSEQLGRLAEKKAKIRIFIRANARDNVLQKQDIQLFILYPVEYDQEANKRHCPLCKEEINEKLVIVRKFHFDFQINHPHQISHIQYGGKCGADDLHLCEFEKGLEIPRIFSLPMCIQSVLDYVINEFSILPTPASDWDVMVTNGERLFISTILNKLENHWNSNNTLFHYYRLNHLTQE